MGHLYLKYSLEILNQGDYLLHLLIMGICTSMTNAVKPEMSDRLST